MHTIGLALLLSSQGGYWLVERHSMAVLVLQPIFHMHESHATIIINVLQFIRKKVKQL